MTSRLEVRLDEVRRRKLEELAHERDASITRVVQELIDRAYEEDVIRKRRKDAAERLAGLEVGKPMSPDELSRLLDEAHRPGDLS